MRPANCAVNRSLKERGFALILIVLVLLGIGGVALFASLSAGVARGERESVQSQAANDVLNAAKLALIGYVVSSPNPTYRPGTFPTPDSYGNGNYDGRSDPTCLGTGSNGLPAASGGTSLTKRCLGKLPWKDMGFDLGSVEASDPLGRVPWLAVSANLVVYDTCLRVLNSDAAALNSPMTASCPAPLVGEPPFAQPTSLPHPWLTVVNESGTVLSNRVAAVLILPGAPIITESRTQQRSAAAPGHPADYLDNIRIPLGCLTGCTTYDNAGLSNVFVSVSPGTTYPTTAEDRAKRGQKIPFNDVMVFLTIDEVMPYIERRVVGEMSRALTAFKVTPNVGSFAWLAPLTTAPSTATSFRSLQNTFFGIFPFMTDYKNGTSNYHYSTDFGWALPGATETRSSACVRIQSSPNIFIRSTVQGGALAAYAPSNVTGKCQWKGLSSADCSHTDTSTITKTVGAYTSNANCNNSTGVNTTSIAFSRVVAGTFLYDPSICSTGSGAIVTPLSDVTRWSYTCSKNITVSSAATVTVTDTLTSYSPITGTPRVPPITGTITLSGTSTGSSISNMRYLPILPNWYIDNLWYQTGFGALGPAFAPTAGTPCGSGITGLTVEPTTGVQAAVMQAGKYLGGGTNPRPSANITDYLEGQNRTDKGGAAPGITNCSFDGALATPTASANDQLLVVAP